MSIPQQLEKLASLHRDGILTDDEFEAAKQRVITEGPATHDGDISAAHLEVITRQNELARIDREWELEREKFEVQGNYGTRYIPTKHGSVGMGIAVGLFGVIWMVFTSGGLGGFGPFGSFPLFGLIFMVLGIGMAVVGYQKASRHERARQRYLRRRRAELSPTEQEWEAR